MPPCRYVRICSLIRYNIINHTRHAATPIRIYVYADTTLMRALPLLSIVAMIFADAARAMPRY